MDVENQDPNGRDISCRAVRNEYKDLNDRVVGDEAVLGEIGNEKLNQYMEKSNELFEAACKTDEDSQVKADTMSLMAQVKTYCCLKSSIRFK